MNNSKIKLLPAREQVASIVRQQILTGQYKANLEITLGEVAKQVGSSNTPVREAFQILEKEGLLELRPNKGAIVCGLTEKSIKDHYEARALLEAHCAGMVCENGVDISPLNEIWEESRNAIEKRDVAIYRDCNQAFHMEIWNLAGNKKIEHILSTLWNGFSLGLSTSEEQYADISYKEHAEIYQAICSRDKDKAKSLMSNHIFRSMNDIISRYRQENN